MPGRHDLAETVREYPTPRGPVPYVDMTGEIGTSESPASAAESWLRC